MICHRASFAVPIVFFDRLLQSDLKCWNMFILETCRAKNFVFVFDTFILDLKCFVILAQLLRSHISYCKIVSNLLAFHSFLLVSLSSDTISQETLAILQKELFKIHWDFFISLFKDNLYIPHSSRSIVLQVYDISVKKINVNCLS